MISKIQNPARMRQIVDFKGLELDTERMYPTDIDGLIEYHDKAYIIIEIKHGNAKVPAGQRVAMQRMVDDFTKVGKRAIAIVCEHNISDVDKPVIAAYCRVREIYYGGEHRWRPPDKRMTVQQMVNGFMKFSKSKEVENAGNRNLRQSATRQGHVGHGTQVYA